MVASVLESRIAEVADTKERTKASGFIDRPRLAFNKRLEQIEEDMNEQLTVFDENLNMNLYTVVTPEENPNVAPGQIGIGTAKARLSGFDMTRYKTTDYPLMLDFFMSYGEDPDNLFEMLFHCASPAPFFSAQYDEDDCRAESSGKSRFIHSLWKHSQIAHTDNYSFEGYTLSTIAQCINPGSLTVMSIPAFMTIAFDGTRALNIAPGVAQGFYKRFAPNRKKPGALITINEFDEYFDAFIYGNFMGSNTDLFLTTYAIANSLCCLDVAIRGYLASEAEIESIEDVVFWKPIAELWQKLVSMNAITDPFGGPQSVRMEEYGVANARIMNPDLADALRIAERIMPFPIYGAAPGSIARVFYALVECFSMQSYFNVSGSPCFRPDDLPTAAGKYAPERKSILSILKKLFRR